MFVQCAKFVERHAGSATKELSVYGQEQKEVTVPLAKMNLALHGLSGDIRLGNSYCDDLHGSVGAFDFVMANPPFNVNGVDKDKLAGDPRFPFGVPKPDNGDYLWIQLLYSSLADAGRGGFVMANSAGDAGHSEREIRRQLVESKTVDVMVVIGTNFFYTVTLPVTLWFLDKGKSRTPREDTVLFIPAPLPPDRPRPSRLPARAHRIARQHRASLPRRAFGHAVIRTRARIAVHDGREICRLDVARSSQPVWSKTSRQDRVFFVRMNNSTRALPEAGAGFLLRRPPAGAIELDRKAQPLAGGLGQ